MKFKNLSLLCLSFLSVSFLIGCGGEEKPGPVVTTYTVTINGGTGSGTYNEGETATATATIPDGQEFVSWKESGEVVSTSNPYSFEVTRDITLDAIFEDVQEAPLYLSNVYVDSFSDFNILCLTDIQLHDGEEIETTFQIIDDVMAQANPDMIVFLGDLLNDDKTYASVNNAQAIIAKIDSYNVPWAPIFGNHDYEDYQTPYESAKTTTHTQLANWYKAATNCLFKEGPADVDGASNYLVNIIDSQSKKPVESLVFLDSRLAGISDSHGQFYNDCVEYTASQNGGENVETVVFTHVALPEYGDAYGAIQASEYRDVTGCVGRNPCDLSTGSHSVFNAIKTKGCTNLVVCGHDHENAYYSEYQGVKLAYAMKSSYGDKHYNPAVVGGALVTFDGEEAAIEYVHSTVGYEVSDDLACHLDQLGYWRYSGATLKFDIEFLSETNDGVGKFNLQGTNLLRYSKKEDERLGMWNRLTGNVDVTGNRTVDCGSLNLISGNKYTYSLDLSTIPLNGGSGEVACGDETIRLIYFHGFSTTNKIKVSNFRYEFEEITETNQVDLATATISTIADQYYNFGQQIRPAVTVTLNGTLQPVKDILVKYSNNCNEGQATITVVPSGKGAHRYKGSISTTFKIIVNPDADTLPGHENAMIINGSTTFENSSFVSLNNWYNSGKSLYFEAKKLNQGTVTGGTTFKFALFGQNSNPDITEPATSNWNRLTANYTVDLVNHNVKNGSDPAIGTVTDLGDGWYSYSIPLNAFALNSGQGAIGNANETLKLLYLEQVKTSFKLDNLSVR